MDLTLHNLSPELHQALVLRAAADKKTLEDALLDAASRDLGLSTGGAEKPASLDRSPNRYEVPCSGEQSHADSSKTTFTVNSYGAILVRPATTDEFGSPLPQRRDLSFLSQGPPLEPEVLAVLEEQRRIDSELWQ